MVARTIKFGQLATFTGKQWDATDAAQEYRFFLYGGARGPGKSHWLRWYFIYRLIDWSIRGYRGVRTLLACEDFPTLRERQLVKIQSEFPFWLGDYYSGERREFVLKPDYGGGVIKFGNLSDVGAYLSAEFALIGIDEISRNQFSTFDKLRGSLRWPGIDDTGFVATSNPEANWVRDLWIERRFTNGYSQLAELKDEFHFLSALPTDNPYLSDEYWVMLRTQVPSIQKAWLNGDWYAGVEGRVYENFTVDNIVETEPDPERPIELAFDDRYIDPRAILFIQRTGREILVFDEIYHSKRLEEESIEMVLDRCEENGWPRPEIAVGSSEAAQLMRRFRSANIVARGGTHKVVEGVKHVRALICDGNGYRALKVHKRCKNLIDEISAGYKYPEGKRGLNEKPQDGNDHACDALRYWCFMRVRI